jgi:hypothetical protein
VIVRDLDVLWPGLGPDETDAPLIVDPNTVLAGTIAPQCLQPIAWRSRQVAQRLGIMQLPQLALCDALKVCPDASGKAAMKQRFGIPISEGADHRAYIRGPS